MSARLIAPLEKVFTLEKTDILLNNTGEPSTVTIRQATVGQTERRASMYANLVQETNQREPDAVRYVTRFSQYELNRVEARLTMSGCNLSDEDGLPLFRFRQDSRGKSILAMTDAEFDEAWGRLPDEVASEIHEKVREVNLQWRPLGEV